MWLFLRQEVGLNTTQRSRKSNKNSQLIYCILKLEVVDWLHPLQNHRHGATLPPCGKPFLYFSVLQIKWTFFFGFLPMFPNPRLTLIIISLHKYNSYK